MNRNFSQSPHKPRTRLIVLFLALCLLCILTAVAAVPDTLSEQAHAASISTATLTPCACGETPTPTRILLPTVSITSPINGTLFTAGLIVPITAIASAPGGIVQVAFYSGSTLLGTSTSAPYSASLKTGPASAAYTLTAVATGSTGETATSAPVIISTTDSTPTPTLIPSTPTPPAISYTVSYQLESQWPGGFTVNMLITNTGSTTINGWVLSFSFPGDQTITLLWNGKITQSGKQVSITNVSYNGTITPKETVDLGFNGSWSKNNANPTLFSLNESGHT